MFAKIKIGSKLGQMLGDKIFGKERRLEFFKFQEKELEIDELKILKTDQKIVIRLISLVPPH